MIIYEILAMLQLLCFLRYVSGADSSVDWYIKKPVACNMTSSYGDCTGNYTRYFFDTTKKRCSKFKYSGCGGNGNNFQDIRKCRYLCGASYNPDRDPCLRPPSNIWCPRWPTFAEMWYFDTNTEKCTLFIYHQCALDSNVFQTCEKCMEACQRHMRLLQTCTPGHSNSTRS
uniref:Putative bilaris n=1 Tax=Rhipicephalus pulchellus TaxID=72859 RepID=L7LRT9_RHIPC